MTGTFTGSVCGSMVAKARAASSSDLRGGGDYQSIT